MSVRLNRRPGLFGQGERALTWLGQAGFWIDLGFARVLIDPYLSDSLAKKYAGHSNDHQRMAPPPLSPHELPEPDLVLVTHAHTDHMDPETLGPLAERFPDLPFVVPKARAALARDRIGASAKLISVSDGERFTPIDGLAISALPAAHETLERDAEGNCVFLGYGLQVDDLTLYHSGDSIPFDGLANALASLKPDIALLPVNGRDAERLSAGIPGNFSLDEAINLCRHASIGTLVPHHFGMFAFNTLDEAVIDQLAIETARPLIVKPTLGERLVLDG